MAQLIIGLELEKKVTIVRNRTIVYNRDVYNRIRCYRIYIVYLNNTA